MGAQLDNYLRRKGYYLKDMVNRQFNPIAIGVNKRRDEYSTIYTQYDMTQCIMRYTWDGKTLDDMGITSMDIERMLYFRGSLCGFKKGGVFYILPYTPKGNLNVYGKSRAIQPLTFNGSKVDTEPFSKGLNLLINSKDKSKDEAVLLFGTMPSCEDAQPIPRFILNQCLISDIADTLCRLNINVVISNKKIGIIVKDPNQKEVIEKEIATAFASDCPFFVLSSELETNVIQDVNDLQGEELFNIIKSYDALRCFMTGIHSSHFGGEKKERLITDETEGTREQTDLVLLTELRLREYFCERCNELFGTDLSVSLTSDIIVDEDVKNVDEDMTGGDDDEV